MPASITILYPNTEGTKFDLEYYTTKHMDLVAKTFKPLGLLGMYSKISNNTSAIGYSVRSISGTADPSTPTPYRAVVHLEFESLKAFGEAMAAKGQVLMEDTPNFTDCTATILIGEEVLASS